MYPTYLDETLYFRYGVPLLFHFWKKPKIPTWLPCFQVKEVPDKKKVNYFCWKALVSGRNKVYHFPCHDDQLDLTISNSLVRIAKCLWLIFKIMNWHAKLEMESKNSFIKLVHNKKKHAWWNQLVKKIQTTKRFFPGRIPALVARYEQPVMSGDLIINNHNTNLYCT